MNPIYIIVCLVTEIGSFYIIWWRLWALRGRGRNCLRQGPTGQSQLTTYFLNRVFLEHSHAYLVMYFVLQQQSWVVVTENVWPQSWEIFITWPLRKNVLNASRGGEGGAWGQFTQASTRLRQKSWNRNVFDFFHLIESNVLYQKTGNCSVPPTVPAAWVQ